MSKIKSIEKINLIKNTLIPIFILYYIMIKTRMFIYLNFNNSFSKIYFKLVKIFIMF